MKGKKDENKVTIAVHLPNELKQKFAKRLRESEPTLTMSGVIRSFIEKLLEEEYD